jgi:hypothetical protein
MNPQDPLAQLRDIHLPDPVSWWPPAPGWWALLLCLLMAIAAGGWRLHRQRIANAYRRLAALELRAAWTALQQDGNRAAYVYCLSQVLRRAALVAYPPEQVNILHGQAWLTFLDETMNDLDAKPFSQGPGQDLLTLPYRPIIGDEDLEPLHNVALRWLAIHGKRQADKVREIRRAAV